MRLEGKRAVVTGAARGIGRAIALKLAQEGADVVIGDLLTEQLEETAEMIRALGRKCEAVKTNIAEKEEAERLCQKAITAFGGLEILVNVAGINRDTMLHKMTDEQWDLVLKVNLTGTMYTTRYAGTYMREKGYGRIVNIASASWLGNVGQANYAASKAGVVGLTKTAARELARKGVTANAICPGFVDTDMTRGVPEKVWNTMMEKIPAGRAGKPEEVAAVVAFLASEEAGYVNGEVINVGGGFVL
ncbi:MAG TPA: 3-oxoacyl-ACP reductase FabG [Symbiobacteriaceae bacterium]|nr:3-oxoacyl-ACP reductase FabG [Symbiobacteriaceae bacterium]